jgi:hypothetical protein
VFLNLTLVYAVLICNLFIVFVNGVGAQDIVTKVVILNFILDQQLSFKRDLFLGNTGVLVLRALKKAFEYKIINNGLSEAGVCKVKQTMKIRNEKFKSFFAKLLLLAYVPILLSCAFIVYGPMCKPGPTKVGVTDVKKVG